MKVEINLAPPWAWNDPAIPQPQQDERPSAQWLNRSIWLAMITDSTNGDTYTRLFRNSKKPDEWAVWNLFETHPELFLYSPNTNTDDVLPS